MNDQPIKKQTFLQGTAVLAMATVLVKLMGFLFKVPLNNIIGEDGFGYFNTAYDVYNVLLMISTTGLPVAMSRMISQAQTLGNHAQIRRIYKTSLYVFGWKPWHADFLQAPFRDGHDKRKLVGSNCSARSVRAAHLPCLRLPRLLPRPEQYDPHVCQPDF